jgi:hypothetical protein
MDELVLIYVGSAGEIDGLEVAEFYFSADPGSAIGPGWEMGARDNVEPPDAEYVAKKFRLRAPGLPLRLLEAEFEQRYLDGVYGVVALAWEYVDYGGLGVAELDALSSTMLHFFYGQTLASVLTRLAARDFGLEVLELPPVADSE